jgi:EAL domain-containing protein (putative c-di-GMP-specific phosphodiesterase class I)
MNELSLFVTKTARELEDLERSITTLREEARQALESLHSKTFEDQGRGEQTPPMEPAAGIRTLLDPYGTLAAQRLMAEQGRISALSRTMVDLFYTTLMTRPDARPVLDFLSAAELDHLQSAQVRYLVAILSPDLSKPDHEKLARETGDRHAMVGLVPASLAEAFSIYRHELERFFSDETSADALTRGIIIERLANDLSWQLVAFSEIEQERARLTEEFLGLFATAQNRRDLLKGALDRIIQIPGVAGASIASLLEGEKVQCEVQSGLVLSGVECLRNHLPRKAEKDNIVRKAFEEERPVLWNTLLDVRLGQGESEEARLLGIRSVSAWPLFSQEGVPLDVLNLYSKWPGYFHSASQQLFWTTLSRSLGGALASLEKNPRQSGLRPVSLSENQRYRTLLQSGQVEMFYQPVVTPHTRELVKFESLARLRDGDQIIAPAAFLPAFGTNQLLLLFEMGLERVRQDAPLWTSLPEIFSSAPRVSINLPAEAFSSRSFLERLEAHSPSGLSADCAGRPVEITLEIVEAGFLDEAAARKSVKALKEAGYRISLDDIGTGDSSIRRLKSLPIDEIKIDQGFVRTLDSNIDHLEFVFSLIDLASALGIDYVLEGVETPLVYDMVTMTGSGGHLQGYEIAHPMAAGEVNAWWERWSHAPPLHHPWSYHGWIVQKEIRLRYTMILCARGAHEMINMASFGNPDACPLTKTLSELSISEDLRAEADRLHRKLHREMETELLGKLPLSHPAAVMALKRIWQSYRKDFVTLMIR